jgi:hypothetical protein
VQLVVGLVLVQSIALVLELLLHNKHLYHEHHLSIVVVVVDIESVDIVVVVEEQQLWLMQHFVFVVKLEWMLVETELLTMMLLQLMME